MSKRNTLNSKGLKKTLNKSSKLKKSAQPCDPDPIGYDDVSKVHPALRPYLGYCLHKVTTILKSQVNSMFEDHQLQGQHFAILSVIASSPDINQMKICEEMGIDKASMVKITDHLEKGKFIERIASKDDRRVKILRITSLGEKFLRMAQGKRLEIEKKFMNPLSEAEALQFKDSILKILDHQKKR